MEMENRDRDRDRDRDRNRDGSGQDGESGSEFVIKVNRVAKTVKGGRNFAFSVLATVGDKKGKVGIAMGKAKGVPNAIMKSLTRARKKQVQCSLVDKGRTIPHPQVGRYGASKILLLPAAPGTGVIAGGAVRPILEALGIKDILTKAFGARNPINLAKATLRALLALRDVKQVAAKRGLTVEELFKSRKGIVKS